MYNNILSYTILISYSTQLWFDLILGRNQNKTYKRRIICLEFYLLNIILLSEKNNMPIVIRIKKIF